MVADRLNRSGIATLLFDLLSEGESEDRRNVFNIELLAARLSEASTWARAEPLLKRLPIGYFGASTGGAAALSAAADSRGGVAAVVSRGGRPDLTPVGKLHRVRAPTLLIVGALDETVLRLNRLALAQLRCEAQLETVTGATHLFEEDGALERVADLATDWFAAHFHAPTE